MPPKINKLKLFDENPTLAVHHELVALNDNLEAIKAVLQALVDKETEDSDEEDDKEEPLDLTPITNELKRLVVALNKEDKKEDIEVSVELV